VFIIEFEFEYRQHFGIWSVRSSVAFNTWCILPQDSFPS